MPARRSIAVLLLATCAACVTTPADQQERSVSAKTWVRVEPVLRDLVPGDDLRDFAAARQVHLPPRRRGERPLVVIPGWISSLSGGAAGGMSMLGQLIGRSEDRLYGSHVFGTVSDGRIVPRFQVVTRATLISPETFERLAGSGTPDIGTLPRPSGILYFRDLHVAGTRALDFVEPGSGDGSTGGQDPVASRAGGPSDFYSRAHFLEAEPVLDELPPGTDLMSMLRSLDAEFVSHDFGHTHSLFAKGFLNTRSAHTFTFEGPSGILKLRPFGWLEDEEAVVKRVAVFENDRLLRVVAPEDPHRWQELLE